MPRKTTQSATGRNHAVARDDERERVGATGLTDGAWRVMQGFGEFAIGARLMVRDRGNLLPYTALKRGSRGA